MEKDDETRLVLTGSETAFVDRAKVSDERYRPQFVFNDARAGRKVLASLERELRYCDEFAISVAFITMSGLITLLDVLQDLAERGVRGRILTTDYLHFSEPRALQRLHEFPNIEIKMYRSANGMGFHTKGYIFRQGDVYRMIVGSANLTANALTKNEEWNTKIVSLKDGAYAYSLLQRFEELWADKASQSFADFYADYRKRYEQEKRQRSVGKYMPLPNDGLQVADAEQGASYGRASELTPNLMQTEFIANMRELRARGAKRALLISATGTGKTYAAAFLARDFAPRRLLFLVHREQIAKQACRSFQRVVPQVTTGLLSGNHKDVDADYLFATMQTMSKADVLSQFDKNAFELIIIDEAHRVGAQSYQKIIDYFEPQFYLGMTASPERTDGFDIYKLFDHNIAYEIRLQQALEEDMLCPFHYFGITDLVTSDQSFSAEEVHDETVFSRLVSDERVNEVLAKTEFYGYSGNRVKGLIFCSSNKEARELSAKFNERGYHTLSLAGVDDQSRREEAIERLVSDDRSDYLDYIFSVDIFNEGVDIPEINQVIMLRPTQSPIVFVQQLGRGLRKAEGKEYVVILDFIGNYLDNNFMIPMALSGDRSYNKDNLRRYLMEGSRVIPGASTIHFDKIAKERIFASIDKAKLGEVKQIKENYRNLKAKLGRIPKLSDFDKYGEMDVLCIFRNKSLGSYHAFLRKYEKEYTIEFGKEEELFLKYISMKFASGKRPHELELLNLLMRETKNVLAKLKMCLESKYHLRLLKNAKQNLVNIMTGSFNTGVSKKTFADCVFIVANANGDYDIAPGYANLLQHAEFRAQVQELIDFGLHRYQQDYSDPYKETSFNLYHKYDYEDVCRLMNWSQNVVPINISGYRYDEDTQTMPVFINYDKAADIQASINYQDRFLNPQQLISISKSKRTLDSDDVQRFVHAQEVGMPIDLFVRKNKDDNEAKSFYYLGQMREYDAKPVKMQATNDDAVELYWQLDTAVREDIYDYLTSSEA